MNHRKIARTALSVLAVLSLMSATQLAAQTASKADSMAARAAAKSWLGLVDRGQYAASWKAASKQFQGAVDTAKWSTALKEARGPFDPLANRTEASLHFVTNPPGAPQGEYAMLQYHAKAKSGGDVTERVVLVHQGGAWKAAGYFIKPGLL